MKLGVNIDHIATIRQARMTNEPDPVYAAVIAELAGADGITIHLRQDRRHMQDRDLEILRRVIKSKLNLEMAMSMEMVKIALTYKPDMCTLVPETTEEITTTGGLDAVLYGEKIEETAGHLRTAGIRVSVFVDPDPDQVKTCFKRTIRTIEINTGAYAKAWNTLQASQELEKVTKIASYAHKMGFRVLAGHGLTYQNVGPIAQIKEIDELNIGHSIVANASLIGLDQAVKRMKLLLSDPINTNH